MSLDISIYIEAVVRETEPYTERHTLYSINITHNLGRMAKECGLYEVMWRPEEHGYRQAKDVIQPLVKGITTLEADRPYFEQFNPSNGWGSYETLLSTAKDYLDACYYYPLALINASR